MNTLEYLFPNNYENPSMMRPILKLINRMAAVNRSNEKIPYTHFYLNILEDKVNIKKDYIAHYLYHVRRWSPLIFFLNTVNLLQNPELTADNIQVPKGPDAFFWFDYPCIMNVIVSLKFTKIC